MKAPQMPTLGGRSKRTVTDVLQQIDTEVQAFAKQTAADALNDYVNASCREAMRASALVLIERLRQLEPDLSAQTISTLRGEFT